MRQTIKVEDIVRFGNTLLSIDGDNIYPAFGTREYKEAVCDMIEKVMHMSGRYGGYYFIDNQLPTDRNSASYFRRRYIVKQK